MAEQAGRDVLGLQPFAQRRVVTEVDLADGEVVGGSPVGVDPGDIGVRERRRHQAPLIRPRAAATRSR
jgi:hypothetical protein